jgi:hypothetical protein
MFSNHTFNKYLHQLILIVVVFIAIILFFNVNLEQIKCEHFDLNGIESYFVQVIVRNNCGIDYYTNPYQYPFYTNGYTPLYYILGDFFYKLRQLSYEPNFESLFEIYHHYRYVSAFCTILTFVIILFFLFRIKTSITQFLIGCLIIFSVFFSFPSTNISVRGDSLTMLFFILHSIIIYYLLEKGKIFFKNIILLSLIGGLAFYSKQTAVSFLIALPFFLLINKNVRQFLSYSITFGLFILSGFALFYSFYGDVFFENCFVLPKSDFNLHWGGYTLSSLFANQNGIVLFIGLLIASHNIKLKKFDIDYFSVLVILSFFVNVYFSFKSGSWINYFNETIIASSILLFKTLSSLNFDKKYVNQMVLIFFMFYVLIIKSQEAFLPQRPNLYLSGEQKAMINKQVEYLISNLNGKTFFSNSDYLNTILSNRLFYPNINVNKYYENKIKDKLLTSINSGDLKYLVFPKENQQGLDELFGVSIKEKFKLVFTIGDMAFYEYQVNH